MQSSIWFSRKVLIFALKSQSNDPPTFCAPEARVDWLDCSWLSLNHYVYFPFTEPGLCMNTRVFLTTNTERTAKESWGAIRQKWQKVYGIRIVDCTFNTLNINSISNNSMWRSSCSAEYPSLCSVTMVILAEYQDCMCFREPTRGRKCFMVGASLSTHRKMTSKRDLPVEKCKENIRNGQMTWTDLLSWCVLRCSTILVKFDWCTQSYK